MVNGCRTASGNWVPGGSEANVVGEDGGAEDVVVPVDGVGAVEDGDGEAGGEGEALHAVDHAGPVGRGGALARGASAGVGTSLM